MEKQAAAADKNLQPLFLFQNLHFRPFIHLRQLYAVQVNPCVAVLPGIHPISGVQAQLFPHFHGPAPGVGDSHLSPGLRQVHGGRRVSLSAGSEQQCRRNGNGSTAASLLHSLFPSPCFRLFCLHPAPQRLTLLNDFTCRETRLHNADWFKRMIALGSTQRYAV